MKENKKFDKLVEELKFENPELWAEAEEAAKEWVRKIKSGEEKLDIQPLHFTEDGNLVEGGWE